MTKPGKAKEKLAAQERPPAEPDEQLANERSPDVTSTRAKSTAHKKVTADKWNQ
jgi:hypothetical protein